MTSRDPNLLVQPSPLLKQDMTTVQTMRDEREFRDFLEQAFNAAILWHSSDCEPGTGEPF